MKKIMVTAGVATVIVLSVVGIFYLQNRCNKADPPISKYIEETSDTANTASTAVYITEQTDNKPESTVSGPGKDLAIIKEDGKVKITDGVFHSSIFTYDTGGKNQIGLISKNDRRCGFKKNREEFGDGRIQPFKFRMVSRRKKALL